MHGVEALAAALEQDADQVDQHMRVARRGLHRGRVAEVGLHGVDLADAAERLQMAGEIGPAHRDADAVMPLRQRPHHMAAEEAGAAKYGDQGVTFCLVVMPLLARKWGARNRGEYRRPRAVQPDGPTAAALQLTRQKRLLTSPHGPGGGIGRRTSFRY